MILGVVGLGLIGGSFAKAYHTEGHIVYALDRDKNTFEFAKLSGVVTDALTKENCKDCDLILVCVYPEAAVDFLSEYGQYFGDKPVVIDCCGTKRNVVDKGMEVAKKYGFTYAGGHPMAGTQFSGFKYAREDLYVKAPMVIVPPKFDDIVLLDKISKLLEPAKFARISVTTAEKHDEIIAFTSQLAHLVSSAYIKSPNALKHAGFSAGSYKDMTRVAWLNPQMWAELFLENKDYLLVEIDALIDNLKDYRNAINDGNREELEKLLQEGKTRKEEVDGKWEK